MQVPISRYGEGVPLMERTDVIVLGAGIIGVSTALHLQQRGRSVVLVDRREPGEETSYGNTGIIQREGVVPYPFPRDFRLIWRYAFNQLSEAHLHWRALPSIAPWLFRYWRASTAEEVAKTALGQRPLIERCILEHEVFLGEAGALGLVRRTGYMRVYRSEALLEDALQRQKLEREMYGVKFEAVDKARISELEPHLKDGVVGGLLMPEPISVSDPGAVVKAYADLFARRGGRFVQIDARLLEQTRDGWLMGTPRGPLAASDVVVALGPWSDDIFRLLGYDFPLGLKRGYHQHFKAVGNATLNRPVLDAEFGYVITPMTRGIRLTTGAEFARRDAPPTPIQLERVTPRAREIFPLGDKAEPHSWLGRRPCLPDMLPIVGAAPRHKGLWFNFGHHHLGFTLGPVTGRLLAEVMTGEAPFTDPRPYRAERF